MGKLGAYQPEEKYKNYLLPTSKPLRSHPFYKEKVWTLQEQIYKKLKKVAELLESLYPKLTDDFSKNVKAVIEKNIEILMKDLDLIQHSWDKKPESFNTNKLNVNERHITDMKNVCDNLQAVRSYEYEFKNLGKIKHALKELEHLILPRSFRSKPKTVPVKKDHILVKAKKKTSEKSVVKSKAISKKIKPAVKLSKQTKKSAKPVHKLKSSERKVAKSKPKSLAKSIMKAKPTSRMKSSAKH